MNYRFSGHETFPCRYAWLPKAYRALHADPKAFSDEDQAMVILGVGKNMVRAIRFWVQAMGVAAPRKDGGYEITQFGEMVFSKDGLDPYLEDQNTLWLLHWNLCSQVDEPLFAWDYMINRWTHPEISQSEVLRIFQSEAQRLERNLSNVTLQQHFEVFLHTYVPTRSRKGDVLEDNLDSPFVELGLIRKIGERDSQGGRRDPIYTFNRDAKPEITPELFIYCLDDFWQTRHPNEKTLTFRHVAVGHGSPGQIFKLSEPDIRERLDTLERDSEGLFQYQESASLPRIIRTDSNVFTSQNLLADIYKPESLHV